MQKNPQYLKIYTDHINISKMKVYTAALMVHHHLKETVYQ